MSYVDTSVIVAAIDAADPRREGALRFLQDREAKIVSDLAVVELSSVLSRRRELLEALAPALGLRSIDETVDAIVLYLIRRFGLRYHSLSRAARLLLIGGAWAVAALAYRLSARVGLRTLDLLHVSYAILLKRAGAGVERLVTLDKEFERAREELARAGIQLVLL